MLRTDLATALGAAYHVQREVRPVGACRQFVALRLPAREERLVKVLPLELSPALDPGRFEETLLEVARRAEHPLVVPTLQAGAAGRWVFYLRPFLAGTTLRAWLDRAGPVPLHRAVRMLRDVLSALAHAHRRGITHGGLRPELVLLTDHTALVTEFGVPAAILRAGATHADAAGLLGATAYLAPEVAGGETPGLPADMYALGALGYEMLTGRRPGPDPVPVRSLRAAASRNLEELVMHCLAPRPADRPADAATLARRLG